MTQSEQGDRVRWRSHGGEAAGEVVKKITADTEAGRAHRASVRRRTAVPGPRREERRRGRAQAGRTGEVLTRRPGPAAEASS